MKSSLIASPILFLLFSKWEDGTGETGTFDAVVKLMFSVTNSLLVIQHHDPPPRKMSPNSRELGEQRCAETLADTGGVGSTWWCAQTPGTPQ